MGAPIKADELFSSWSRGQWKSVYLFTGTEDFLIDQALAQAMVHWLADDTSGLNIDRLDGETQSAADIFQAMDTVPFLGSMRVVRVDHASSLSAADQEALAERLKKLSPQTALIFIWGKEWRRDDASKPLVDAVLECGYTVIFWPLFPEAAQRWLVQRAKIYKKTLALSGAAWLVQQSGENLRLLDQELLKCCAYVGERPSIDLDDLQASFGYQKSGSPFEWLALMREQNSPRALVILERLLQEGEEPLRLLALLSKTVRDWLSAKNSGDNAALLALRFHVKRGDENRFVQELARWKEEDLEEALANCVAAEQKIKTGKETPAMALTLLTLSFGRLEAADALR